MNKYIHPILLVALMPLSSTWAMQAMDDDSLAQQTGQDGVSIDIQLPNSTIAFSEAALIDTDGMVGATGSASLVVAPATFNNTQGIRFFKNNSSTDLATAPIKINMDADGNTGNPVLNTAISLPSDLGRIRINPFSIYLASGSDSIFQAGSRVLGSTGTIKTTGVTELLKVNGEGIDVVFKDADPVSMNVQLGNAPQEHMFMFTGGSISCIANNAACMSVPKAEDANPIEIMSKNGSGMSNLSSSLKLNFALTATNPTTGFRLAGFYGDINDDGLTFGKDGTTDKFDAIISNVVAGKAGDANAATFNNLKNGSIGNFGVIGASVKDLKVNVRGM